MVKRGIRVVWTDRLVDHVVQLGFDSRFGARPLQRVIEKEVVTPLALRLNADPHLRDTQVTVDFDAANDRVLC
jgi:ATP-dependent Clp protease ATP-binding subunit ClpA